MSSGPELSVQLSLNDAKLLVGLANALKQQDKFTDGVGRTVDEAKKAEAELLKFANAAKRIDVTPQERYQKAIQQTDEALKKGLFTEEQATRARARAKAELDKHNVSLQQTRQNVNRLSDAYREQERVAGQFRDVADQLGVVTTAAGVTTLAIRAIGDAWQYAEQQATEAGEAMKAAQPGRNKIGQVSMSAADATALNQQADQVAAKYGIDRNVSRRILFSARSEGFDQYFEQVAATKTASLDPEAAAGVAGQVKSLFPKADISPIEAVNLTYAGAKASRLSFEQVAAALPKAAEGTAPLGSTPQETIAIASVLASSFASGETTADRIKAFSNRAFQDKDFRGLGVMGSVRKLQGMSEDDRAKWLGGNAEANAAFFRLSENSAAIGARQTELDTVLAGGRRGDSFLDQQRAAWMSQTQNVNTLRNEQATVQREIQLEQTLGARAIDFDTVRKNAETALLPAYKNRPVERWSTSVLMGGMNMLGFEPATVARTVANLESYKSSGSFRASQIGLSPDSKDQKEAIEMLKQAAIEQREAAKEQKAAAQAARNQHPAIQQEAAAAVQ